MNHAFFVGCFQARGQLLAKAKNFTFGKRTPRKFGLERQAGHVLSDEVINPIVLAEIECHGDAGIGDPAEAQCFPAKLPSRSFAQ